MTMLKEEKIEMKRFHKFLLNTSPKHVPVAVGMVLNDAARETSNWAKLIIQSEMTTRSKFALSRIQYTKSKFKGNINQLFSVVGSIKARRFTGWAEQELGTKTDRHVATVAARGGKAKPIRRGARLAKPYFTRKRFPKRGQMAARMARSSRGGNWEVPAMLNILGRMRYRQPFIIAPGYKNLPPGLYRLKGKNKLQMLQGFDPPNVQPERIKWLSTAVKRYVNSGRIGKSWMKAAKRTFAPKRKRW